MARRKLPQAELCRLKPERFRDMTSDQLMNVWKRYGAGAPTHKKWHQKLKALVVARAVSKTTKGDAREGYVKQADRLEREIYDLQVKAGCKLDDREVVARDLEHEGDFHRASVIRGRRRPIIR